jgi:hypothetical protein
MRVFITAVDRPAQELKNLVFSINMRSLDRDELDKQWFILSAPFPPQGYRIGSSKKSRGTGALNLRHDSFS